VYALTLPEAAELFEYWADYPPTHALLGARYGHKPTAKARKPASKEEAVQELSMLLGAPAQAMPKDLSEAIAWAESVKKDKLKIN
jgi:hypothetical protein